MLGAVAEHRDLQVDNEEQELPAEFAENMDDEKEENEEVEVEMGRPRIGVRPVLPTKAEVAQHYPLHLEYPSLCDHCRAGKARLAPHICEPADRERRGITISCDYAFMGSK